MCKEATRISKLVDKKTVETETVILDYEKQQQLPSTVSIGYLKFRLRMCVPSPMRCKNCLRLEHTSKHCTNKPRCLHCGLEHSYENCPSKETIAHRCANCGGGHSAVDKTCPKFVCIQDKLKNAATKRQSYQHVLVGHDTAAAAVDPLVAQTTIGPIESIKLYFESSFEKFATQFTSDIQRVLGEYGSAIQKVKAVMSEQIDKVEKKNFGA